MLRPLLPRSLVGGHCLRPDWHDQGGSRPAATGRRRELFRPRAVINLFQPIPVGVVLDDVYWPIGVALQGKRVSHDSRAVAYDRLPERMGDEFRRKVRTLTGNFRASVGASGQMPSASHEVQRADRCSPVPQRHGRPRLFTPTSLCDRVLGLDAERGKHFPVQILTLTRILIHEYH